MNANPLTTQAPDYTVPMLDSILLASDFSAGSLTAFQHALKAALVAKCKLTIFHVSPEVAAGWTDFPGVRDVLEQWGLLPPDSPRSAVPELGIEVRKVIAKEKCPVKAVSDYLRHYPADLIMLATHAHEGRRSWLQQEIGEPISRRARQMTLFIPDGTSGFVSALDGSVSLEKILIPIASKPDPQAALEAAARVVARLKRPQGTFVLLHVGEAETIPSIEPIEVPGWTWKTVIRTGDVIHEIVDAANKESADLVVMSTDGRNGFLDALRGSHSERILQKVPCPLLSVPQRSSAEDVLMARHAPTKISLSK